MKEKETHFSPEKENTYNFKEGALLLVDKPLHWTSFDVVNKLRWRLKKGFQQKKFKVGHAGTLDPLATGLLVICTGKSTKLSQQLSAEEKSYTGTFLLGKTTPSYDLETEFNQTFDTHSITTEEIIATAASFAGKQMQTPPIFSAKKVDGKRAYTAARKGKEIKLEEKEINILSFKITKIDLPKVDFHIRCSKGTYIRSIANDFGKKLNNGATLIALRRTASGSFTIEKAKTVDEWLHIINQSFLESNRIG